MNKLNKNEKGFSALETILVFTVVMLLGVMGWQVYKHEHKAIITQHVQVTKKTGWLIYKSSNSTAEFQYPANWKLAINSIQSTDKYTLENLTISGPNNFKSDYSLSKTNHNPIIQNEDCVAPPKITILENLNNNLAISYSSYVDVPIQLWIGSTGDLLKGNGYATSQCQVGGIDYVSMPNDEYIYLNGYYSSNDSLQNSKLKTTDYLNQPEVKTAIDILKSFSL